MWRLGFVILLTATLMACNAGGNGDQMPAERPDGYVTGRVFAGPVSGANVKVYEFTSGTRGDLVGTGITNNDGEYNISIQAADGPLLIEATGGRYVEEASGISISLADNNTMLSYTPYTQGASVTAHVTHYTTIGVGLAEYLVGRGDPAETAFSTAFSRINGIFGINVVTETPLDITNVANRSITVQPGHAYGFHLAALSDFSAQANVSNEVGIHALYNSYTLTKTAYQDVRQDGKLDGLAGGVLSIGTMPLSTSVYRHYLARAVLNMASSARNQTGLNGTALKPAAVTLNDSASSVFDDSTPIPLDNTGPAISIVSPEAGGYTYGDINVSATVMDFLGVAKVEFLFDGVHYSYANNVANPVAVVDTTKYKEGAHTVTVRATNNIGVVSEVTREFEIDNLRFVFVGGSVSNGACDNGCYTSKIYSYRVDPETGNLSHVSSTAVDAGAEVDVLLTTRETPYLYGISGRNTYSSSACNIYSYRINANGSLTLMSSIACPELLNLSNENFAIDPRGRFIVVSSPMYNSDYLAVLPVNANGGFAATAKYQAFIARQVRNMVFSSDGGYLYTLISPAASETSRQVEIWRIDGTSLTYLSAIDVPLDTVRLHVHPDSKIIYSIRGGGDKPYSVDAYTLSSTTGMPAYLNNYANGTYGGFPAWGGSVAFGSDGKFFYLPAKEGIVLYDRVGGELRDRRVVVKDTTFMYPVDGISNQPTVYGFPLQTLLFGGGWSSSVFYGYRVNQETGALTLSGTYPVPGIIAGAFAMSRAP